MRRLLLVAVTLALVWTTPVRLRADTHTAASCSSSAVQAAITAASDGDTVSIPAGACTWTTAVVIPSATYNPDDTRTKMVKIVGAGTSATTGTRITAAVDGAILEVWMSHAISRFELSGIRFIQSTSVCEECLWGIQLSGHADTYDSLFRIHDNYFQYKTNEISSSILVGSLNSYGTPDNGRPYLWGLIDNNTFSGNISFQGIEVSPIYSVQTNGVKLHGDNIGHVAWRDWTVADHQGTWKNVIIEQNTITSTSLGTGQAFMDCGGGGAYVFRHNTITNNWTSAHGPDSAGWRGCKWMEVYSNDYITNSTSGGWVMAIGNKGGSVVVWDNHLWDASHKGTGNPKGITGTVDFAPSAMFTMYIRAGKASGIDLCGISACGDSSTVGCDNMDVASDPGKGWLCMDQVGAKKGNASAGVFGYSFAQEPQMFWANHYADSSSLVPLVLDGSEMEMGDAGDAKLAEYVKVRRDYINEGDCTGHMGETICAAFWDDTNKKKLNYTAYTYPHPLAGGVPVAPNAPTNVRIR